MIVECNSGVFYSQEYNTGWFCVLMWYTDGAICGVFPVPGTADVVYTRSTCTAVFYLHEYFLIG